MLSFCTKSFSCRSTYSRMIFCIDAGGGTRLDIYVRTALVRCLRDDAVSLWSLYEGLVLNIGKAPRHCASRPFGADKRRRS